MTQIGGVGHHVTAVPVATFQTWLQLSKVLEFTYTPAVMFAKLAALFLYHQVFEVTSYRRLILLLGAVIVLQGVVALVLAFSICRPFRYFWTQAVDVHDGTCGDVMLFYKLYSVPSLVTDVVMLVIPWPILLKLQMPTSEKVGLMLTFLAASMGIITCVLRFSVFFTTPLFSDPTWYASGGPMIYALVEPSIYMIASIIPTTRHLYRRLHRRLRTASGSARSSRRGDTSSSAAKSAELAALDSHASSGRAKITRLVDIQQDHATASQEELTLGEWYHSREDWHRPKTAEETPAVLEEGRKT